MTSKPVAFLLADLGVTKSHSRPHVSNDNPHIESLFKTVKYQPEFPSTFANLTAARAFCRAFFTWYNTQHRHSSLALLTPSDVHHGRAHEILERGSSRSTPPTTPIQNVLFVVGPKFVTSQMPRTSIDRRTLDNAA